MRRYVLFAAALGMCIRILGQSTTFQYEYWFDDDSTIQTGDINGSMNMAIDISKLSTNIHTLHIQLIDADGVRSSVASRIFFKLPEQAKTCYYWYDNRHDKKTELPATGGAFSLDVSDLQDGLHTLHYQMQYEDFLTFRSETFIKIKPTQELSYDYWFDDNSEDAAPLNDNNGMAVLSLEGLSDGLHTVNFRISDPTMVSTFVSYPFIKVPQVVGAGQLTWIISIDGKLYKKLQTDGSDGVLANFLDVETIAEGEHSLSVHVVTASGTSSDVHETTFYRVTREMEESEWEILKKIYESMGSGKDWNHDWTLTDDPLSAYGLYGVSYKDGHVTAIVMKDNNIKGKLPVDAFSLPKLEKLDLSGNQIAEELNETLTQDAAGGSIVSPSLRHLDLSHNMLTGNAAVMGQITPNLDWLNMSYNLLTEVSPRLPQGIEKDSLNLSHQQIAQKFDLRELHERRGNLAEYVPTILLYNHSNVDSQVYDTALKLQLGNADLWQATLTASSNQWLVNNSSRQVYRGQDGDTLTATAVNGSHRLTLTAGFDRGDVNFDYDINVIDLQKTINFAMDDNYAGVFNFTAADLATDEEIDVLDVVRLVNLLLAITPEEGSENMAHRRLAKAAETELDADATLKVDNGYLVLSTTRPIASADIVVRGGAEWLLKDNGYQSRQQTENGLTHIIHYSLAGKDIPAGETVLCRFSGTADDVLHVMMVDADAQPLTVALTDETTGIFQRESIETSDDNNAIYDLSGRKLPVGLKLQSAQKGIYIKNNRKVVVK